MRSCDHTCASCRFTSETNRRRSLREVEPQRDSVATLDSDGGHHVVRLLLGGNVGGDDVDTALAERERHGLADTSAGAGDEDDRGLLDRHGSRFWPDMDFGLLVTYNHVWN